MATLYPTSSEYLKSKEGIEILRSYLLNNLQVIGAFSKICSNRIDPEKIEYEARKEIIKGEKPTFRQLLKMTDKHRTVRFMNFFSILKYEYNEKFVTLGKSLFNGIIPLIADDFDYVPETAKIVFTNTHNRKEEITLKQFLKLLNRELKEFSDEELDEIVTLLHHPEIEYVITDNVVEAYINLENTGSCMAYYKMRDRENVRLLDNDVPNYLEIFHDNEGDVFKVMEIRVEGELKGRCLIAKMSKGTWVLHKPYLSDNLTRNQVTIINEYLKSYTDDLEDWVCWLDDFEGHISLKYELRDYDALPYMDIFQFTEGDECLYTYEPTSCYELTETNGSNPIHSNYCCCCGEVFNSDYIYRLTAGRREGEYACEDCHVTIDFGCNEGETVLENEAYYSQYNQGYCML